MVKVKRNLKAESSSTATKKPNDAEKDPLVETDSKSHLSLPSTSATDPDLEEKPFSRRKRRLHAHERAQLVYEKIQAERRLEAENRRIEREKRAEALKGYLSTKRKMDKALLKRNKRGQPNLNAQVQVLLEKIEKRMSK